MSHGNFSIHSNGLLIKNAFEWKYPPDWSLLLRSLVMEQYSYSSKRSAAMRAVFHKHPALLSTVPVGERQYVRARVLIKNLPKRSKFFLLLQRQTAPTAADDTKDRCPVRSATKSHCECLVLVLWFCLNQHPCVSIACGACGKLRRPGGTTTTTTYQRAVLQRRRIFFVFKSSRRRASQAWIWNSLPLLV